MCWCFDIDNDNGKQEWIERQFSSQFALSYQYFIDNSDQNFFYVCVAVKHLFIVLFSSVIMPRDLLVNILTWYCQLGFFCCNTLSEKHSVVIREIALYFSKKLWMVNLWSSLFTHTIWATLTNILMTFFTCPLLSGFFGLMHLYLKLSCFCMI